MGRQHCADEVLCFSGPFACDNRGVDLELTPRLRGVFHLWALFASLAAGAVLVVLADGPLETVSSWIYAAALAGMFGASALYHRFQWKSPPDACGRDG